MLRIGQNGRAAVCTNMVVMEMHFVRVRGAKHLAPRARKATEPLTKRGGLELTAQPVCDFQEVLSQHQDDS